MIMNKRKITITILIVIISIILGILSWNFGVKPYVLSTINPFPIGPGDFPELTQGVGIC